MNNELKKYIVAGVVYTGLSVLISVPAYFDHKKQEKTKQEELAAWSNRLYQLQQRECSNSVHYLKKDGHYYHGSLMEGLGWSEGLCPKESNRHKGDLLEK